MNVIKLRLLPKVADKVLHRGTSQFNIDFVTISRMIKVFKILSVLHKLEHSFE
jgi:hypothetical protein